MFNLPKTLTLKQLGSNVVRLLSTNGSSKPNHYDIIVTGGGMVGSTMACALGKNPKLSDKSILLLEGARNSDYEYTEQYSNRVVALNPATTTLLDSVGVWEYIKQHRFSSVKKIQVWDACSDALITFNDHDLTNIAYIVENDLLSAGVKQHLNDLPNVKVQYESRVKQYTLPKKDEPVRVEMGDAVYTCDLLIGADGANSMVRKTMGVHYLQWNYDQMGIVATVKLTEPTENIVAWQRFLPTGPIALLPLRHDLSSLVWTVPNDEAKRLLKLPEDQFVDAINEAFWNPPKQNEMITNLSRTLNDTLKLLDIAPNPNRQLPPSAQEAENRAAFPLGFGHASTYVQPRVALIGDAAHRVHPLAGQGVNLGFGDVACLNELLGESVINGERLGKIAPLLKYQCKRQSKNVPAALAIDGLQKLYCTDLTPVVLLRTCGLQLVHSLSPLKKQIIQFASQ